MMNPSSVKILIVDDEEGLRNMLAFVLGAHGYQVTAAMDGQEAVEKFGRESFQVVISDIMMPRMNGMQALEAIKKISPATPVILVTGYGTPDLEAEAKAKGAFGFIQKPYDVSELNASILRALEAA